MRSIGRMLNEHVVRTVFTHRSKKMRNRMLRVLKQTQEQESSITTFAPPKPQPKPKIKPKPTPAPKPPALKLEKKPRIRKRRIYSLTEIKFIERLVWMKTRGVCFYCKNPVSHRYSEVPMIKDHHIPLIRGGVDDHSNLVPSCKHCDSLKSGTLPWELKNRFTGKPMVCFPPKAGSFYPS